MEAIKRRLLPEQTNGLESPNKKVRNNSPKKKVVEDFKNLFDDDFDLIDTDFNKENHTNNLQNMKSLESLDLSSWKRCIVESIQSDPKTYDLILQLQSEDTTRSTTCRLQGPWCYTKVVVQQIVSVQGIWSSDFGCYVVNAVSGYIVTNPDCLISGTSVVGSLFCRRKGVLQDKFRGLNADNKIMTVGSIIHELLQVVLTKKLSSYEEIEKAGKMLLSTPEAMFTLYSSKMSHREAEEEIQRFLPNMVSFVDQYILGKHPAQVNKDTFSGCIDSIKDIEENLWVPQLGLKGKIDVSVQIRRNNTASILDKIYVPLELKTGASSFSAEHKGQVILYQMMLSEMGHETNSGLLLYLRNGLMREIPATRNEKRDLVILRNDLCYYLNERMNPKKVEVLSSDLDKLVSKFESLEMPKPISHHSACGKCPYNTICCSFLKADNTYELQPNHPLEKVSKQCMAHLKNSDLEYFIHWCGILSLEEHESRKTNSVKCLWTESPEDRSHHGKAIINLKILGDARFEDGKYIHTLTPIEDNLDVVGCRVRGKVDLTLSGIGVGEYVVVSTTKRIAVAAGHVYDLTKSTVSLRLERNLTKNYSAETFIVDKHESQSGNIFNYTNLGVLLDDTEKSGRLRRIVIDKAKPTFSKVLPKVIATAGIDMLASLNPIQRKAVMKALTSNEFMLIKGLPGTGKTQTLVTIIRLLCLIGKSVLVTSHTHSAVDNVLLRIRRYGLKFIRLGSDARIIPQLLEYGESRLTENCKTPEDLKQTYSSYNIVGVTCLGASHPIFTYRTFDVCIVDEATQVFQPTVLRPLFYAHKFILVGDPEQLPPLVRSTDARALGADESLFQRLDSLDATFVLTLQYRMNRCITKMANELTYAGELRCANDSVALGSLDLPNKKALSETFKTEKWLLRTLEKHVDLSVIFLDTQNCLERSCQFAELNVSDPSRVIESRFSQNTSPKKRRERRSKYTNYCDAAVALKIVKALVLSGCHPESIGIVAPYRAQVELLRKIFEDLHNCYKKQNADFSRLEVNTVDQYQGRDKEVIIYSCTKSGPVDKSKDIEILEDRRRLTVAITRSKHKLIIIGDEECLKSYTPFRDLLAKIPSRCKIKLEDGNLGFSWTNVLADLREVMSSQEFT